jgi:hypothetical protein
MGEIKRNGSHSVQRAVLRDSGITFVGKFYYFCTLVARREVCVSRYHAKLQKRYTNIADSARIKP